MTELEKVEKLREKADVSFAEAKEALDIANGDILDALIYLEKQGKTTAPAGGGFYSSAGTSYSQQQQQKDRERGKSEGKSGAESKNESFSDVLKRFGRFCAALIRKGNSNFLDATKGDREMFSCPVTIVVLFLVFFFWITVPLFIISLFFGFRYHFRGTDLGKDSVNRVMDGASDVVEDVKKSFTNKASGANNNDSADSAADAEDETERI